MTCDIYDSGFVLTSQWQKASCEIHGSVEIHVDLVLNYGVSLPLEFTETHDTGIVHKITEFCGCKRLTLELDS